MPALQFVSQRQQLWRISAVDEPNKEGNKQEPLVPKRRRLGWLRKAPRIRYRLPENRCPDQLLELTVLNERLLGSSPWEVRRKVEYLKKKQEHWDIVYEIIVKRGAAATLKNIEEACSKVEVALSEQSKDSKSLVDLRKELIDLQKEVKEAHEKLHFTQSCVLQNLNRIQKLKDQIELSHTESSVERLPEPGKVVKRRSQLNGLMDYWYPVAFSSKLEDSDKLIPFDLFGRPWVLFRDESDAVACVQDECAHRACPLSIGKAVDGRICCPYHGWEYNGDGTCVKMPSTVYRKDISINTLPSMERDGFIWVWPGTKTPDTNPHLAELPRDFEVVSEIDATVPVDQSLCLSNLLDEDRSPFHPLQSFFPSDPGSWKNQRFESSFDLPCCVTSVMDISGANSEQRRSIQQLHVCLPAGDGQVRILYRISVNFGKWIARLPLTRKLFEDAADKALKEDVIVMKGQQERMKLAGAHTHTELNLPQKRNNAD